MSELTKNHNHNRSLQASLTVLLLISIITAFYYLTFLLDFRIITNVYLYGILLFVEFYIILQTIGTWWTTLYTDYNPRNAIYYDIYKRFSVTNKPDGQVAVFITVYGEDLGVIRKTAIAARDMLLEHQTYILDDGRSDEVRQLAAQLGIGYISRNDNKDKKAGNVNNALKLVKADYVAIFDADHSPKPNFLLETLPFFHDPKVAFVQTPQVLSNRDNFIAIGSAEAQKVFYDLVCNGKNKFNSMFWVGTNAIFKKVAFNDVGGVYPHSSEDIMTSYLLHQRGWTSIYIPEVLAVGNAPNELGAYFKQQLRWAGGGFSIFFNKNPLFSRLSMDQKIQYFITSIFYFSGLVTLLLILIPIIYLYTGQTPISSSPMTWLVHYVPFFLCQFIVILIFLKKLSWEAYIVAINTFPAYIMALWQTLLGKSIKWNVTGSKSKGEDKLSYLWPHFVLLIIAIGSIPVGLLNIEKNYGTTILSIFWTSFNIFSIASFLWLCLKPKPNKAITTEAEAKTNPENYTNIANVTANVAKQNSLQLFQTNPNPNFTN